MDTGGHGGNAGLAEARVEPFADEGLDVFPVIGYRLPIVARREVGETQEEGRYHLKSEVPAGRGEGEGALAALHRTVLVVRIAEAEIVGHIGRDPAQPAWIVQGGGKGLGLTQVCNITPNSLRAISA